MSGPLLTLFYNDAKLRKGHQDMLRMLKTAAEGLVPRPSSPKPRIAAWECVRNAR